MIDYPLFYFFYFLLFLLVVFPPVGVIVRRAGFSRWWGLLILWPGVNLVMLWVFAHKRWPAVDGPATIVEQLRRGSK